jgi:hypothetical protein
VPGQVIINCKPAIITTTVDPCSVNIHYNCDIWFLNTYVSSVMHYTRRIWGPSEKSVILTGKGNQLVLILTSEVSKCVEIYVHV